MKFAALSAISALAVPTTFILGTASAAESTVPVTYEPKYDNPNFNLLQTACSDGQNGLVTKHYNTTGSLPSFPNVGGASTVGGWNSSNCGSCYKLTLQNNSIYVTAIDSTQEGFNIALAAMNNLTNNLARQLGRVLASYDLANRSECGF
jgi:Cerato-platanin